jgi:hypothetical protein
MTATDHRQTAQSHVNSLIDLLQSQPEPATVATLVAECEALGRAIQAFHMEGIRFRMYNVDRLLSHGAVPLPGEAAALFAGIRKELEAAGFHTRSHQAPG